MSGEFTPEACASLDGRSGGVCELCGAARATQRHHRRPRAAGGTKRPETGLASNGLHTCAPCHSVAESHRKLATLLGWLVPQGFDPATQPCLVRGEWVRLTPDGGKEAA